MKAKRYKLYWRTPGGVTDHSEVTDQSLTVARKHLFDTARGDLAWDVPELVEDVLHARCGRAKPGDEVTTVDTHWIEEIADDES